MAEPVPPPPIDLLPIEDDTAFMFLHNVTGMDSEKLAALVNYRLAVHRHLYGPPARIEIASSTLTKKQKAVIVEHAAKLGLPVAGFTSMTTGTLRRRLFPPPDYRRARP